MKIVLASVLQRNRMKNCRKEQTKTKREILRNWLTQFRRLANLKLAGVDWQETQGRIAYVTCV